MRGDHARVKPRAGLRYAALRLEDDGLTPDEVDATRQLLDDAQARLPRTLRLALEHDIVVRWTDTLDAQVHGRAGRDALLLNRSLLAGLTGPDATRARRDARSV